MVPFSLEKERRRRSMVLHCKMRIRELKGGAIDAELKEKRRKKAETKEEISSVEESEEMFVCSKKLWIEMMIKGKEFREKNCLIIIMLN